MDNNRHIFSLACMHGGESEEGRKEGSTHNRAVMCSQLPLPQQGQSDSLEKSGAALFDPGATTCLTRILIDRRCEVGDASTQSAQHDRDQAARSVEAGAVQPFSTSQSTDGEHLGAFRPCSGRYAFD